MTATTTATTYTHIFESSIKSISWRKNLKLDCLESRNFLSVQQSFTDGKDLPDIACFLNRNEFWYEEKLLLAINFVKSFMLCEDPVFNPKIKYGIHSNDNPCCYNIIMLLLLCQKYEIEVEDSDTSESIYRMLRIVTASRDELLACLTDSRNLNRLRETSIRGFIHRYDLQFYSDYSREPVYDPPLHRRFYPELPKEKYPDLQHLAWLEGAEFETSMAPRVYYEWLSSHPPSFYFSDQVSSGKELPERTLLEKKRTKYPAEQIIYNPDFTLCSSLDEILAQLSSAHGQVMHPFRGSHFSRQDILKLRRRFLDAHNLPLYREDYEHVDIRHWHALIRLGKQLRENSEEVHDSLRNVPVELENFRLLRVISEGCIQPLNVSIGQRVFLIQNHPEYPEACTALNSNYFIDTGCYACRSLGFPMVEEEGKPFIFETQRPVGESA